MKETMQKIASVFKMIFGYGIMIVLFAGARGRDAGAPAGVTDFKAAIRYARYNKRLLEIARELPYVRTLHNFRLLNENAMLRRGGIEQNQIGGLTEVYFGLFTDPEEGCRPRSRALAIQELTGSTADLNEMGKRLTNREA